MKSSYRHNRVSLLKQSDRLTQDRTSVDRATDNQGLSDPTGLTVEALGSYRRGKADSGDCDVLLTHDDGVRRHQYPVPRGCNVSTASDVPRRMSVVSEGLLRRSQRKGASRVASGRHTARRCNASRLTPKGRRQAVSQHM